MKPGFRAISSVLTASLLAGCFVVGFEVSDSSGTSTTSSSTGTGAGGAGGAEPMCPSTRWPASTPGAPGGDGSELFFALREIDFGESNLATRPGFDLDGVCSCCEGCEGESCVPGDNKPSPRSCDAVGGEPNGGIDNAFAVLVQALSNYVSGEFGSAGASEQAESGVWSVLVRVSDYNLKPFDDKVTVAIYTTDGLVDTDGLGGAGPGLPAWLGEDDWTVRAEALAPGATNVDAPTILSTNAYVADGRLVGIFDGESGGLKLNVASQLDVNLGYAIFSADLQCEGGCRLRNGVMGGMWSIDDAFAAIGAVKVNFGGALAVCKGTSIYSIVKSSLCGARDALIGTPKPVPCNAISFGLGFNADPIKKPTTISDIPAGESPCTPGTEPKGDTCD
jgi:hypothetical protein